jgi:hypothetical protein
VAGTVAPGVRTVSALAHTAFRTQRLASVVVEFAVSAPVRELRAAAIGPTFLVVDVFDRRITIGCGAPVSVPGPDERFERSVEGPAPGVTADDDPVAGDQPA